MRAHPLPSSPLFARAIAFVLCGAIAVTAATPVGADDTALFSTSVAPNVLLLIDNSGSMNELVFHAAFNGTGPSTCTLFTAGQEYFWNGNLTATYCGRTRTLWDDTTNPLTNRIVGEYLNWYFSPESDPYFKGTSGANNTDPNNIDATANGTRSQCLQAEGYPATFSLYRRSKITAAQDVLRDVICQVNAAGKVRFGLAQFFDCSVSSSCSSGGDPMGGWVGVPIADYSSAQGLAMDNFIKNLSADAWTPLAESLYNIYRYFQSRTNPADGQSGTFPVYNIKTDGTTTSTISAVPPTPVQAACQKNFVIIITDGEPTMDDFTGMSQYYTLVARNPGGSDGDYNPDNVLPEAGVEKPGDSIHTAYYLDDLAKFMHEKDFQKDFAGTQTIDIYTIGFTTSGKGNQLLQKTAAVGGGTFYTSNYASDIATFVVSQVTDIIQKSQSFTSATVPAARTTQADNFYATYFHPRADSPFWEGHLKNFQFTPAGDILTGSGTCAVGDPTLSPPCPNSGTLATNASGVTEWGANGDAADGIPAPLSRNLLVGRGNTSFAAQAARWFNSGGGTSITRFDVGLDTTVTPNAPDSDLAKAPYNLTPAPVSTANRDTLTLKLVSHLAGCNFGTLLGSSCVTRTSQGVVSQLGDIFHSNPIVIGWPNAPINDAAYDQFASQYHSRDRMIYAGSNDGFLRGIKAGTFQTLDSSGLPLNPPKYDRGTGAEVFGYMPTEVRKNIWKLPISEPIGTIRQYTSVDGSPVVSDVWMYRNVSSGALSTKLSPPVSTTRVKDQWRTMLMAGLRDGGRSYYALDISNPAGSTYPGYLWDFPCVECTSAVNPNSSSVQNYMGNTWSEPVITRVKVAVDGQTGGQERWVAIFGAGYDPCSDPNSLVYFNTASGQTCDASDATKHFRGRGIFIVDVTTGELLAEKVFTASATNSNGSQIGYPALKYGFASAPAVIDIDHDGYADVIYIGDLGGQMWKWVIHAVGDDPINNSIANKSLGQPNWPFTAFFQAPFTDYRTPPQTPAVEGLGSHYQSFFFPPAAVVKQSRLTLAFGAGERTNPTVRVNDDATTDTTLANNNRFYVVKDVDPLLMQTPVTLTESNLINATNQGSAATCASTNSPGYYLIGDDGEKFITNAVVFLGTVITGSYLPPDPSASDPCTNTGTSFIYRFRLDCAVGQYSSSSTKEARRQATGTGLPTRPRVSVGSIENPNQTTANRSVVITSDGTIVNSVEATPGKTVDLESWRER